MAAAFAQCFANGYEQVLLLGSDIPGIDGTVLAAANQALTDHDAVLLPTLDGGYGLIGLHHNRLPPTLFTNIPWSTDRVVTTTLERLSQLGLRAIQLPTLRDIDTIEDLRLYSLSPALRAFTTNRCIKQLCASTPCCDLLPPWRWLF